MGLVTWSSAADRFQRLRAAINALPEPG